MYIVYVLLSKCATVINITIYSFCGLFKNREATPKTYNYNSGVPSTR